MKGEYISKDYFDSTVQKIVQSIKQDTRSQVELMVFSIKQDTKEQIYSFGLSIKQDFKDQLDSFRMAVNARFDGVEGRLESLEDDMSKVKHVVLSTDASIHNLVNELERHDVSIDRSKVFTV